MSDLSAAGIYSNSKRCHPLWLPLFVFWCPGQLHCSKQQYTRLFCALLVMSWSERHKAWVEQTHFLFSLFTSMSLHAYQLYLRDSWPRNKKDFSSHVFSILIQRRSLTYSISSTLLSCSQKDPNIVIYSCVSCSFIKGYELLLYALSYLSKRRPWNCSRCVPFIREVSVSPLSVEWGISPPAKVSGPSGEVRRKQLCSFIGLIYLFYVLAGI